MTRLARSAAEPLRDWRWQLLQLFAFVLVILLCSMVGAARAATPKSGTISADEAWDLAGSPYVLTGNVTVAAGVTLTIDQGVTVQGNAATRVLTVNGSLVAVGTAGQPITFTSTSDSAPGQWLGISFGSGAGTGMLKHVRARYGGGGSSGATTGLLKINGGTVTIEDSTFSHSSASGVAMHGGTSGTTGSATIKRTKSENNGADGFNGFNARFVIEESAFWSNGNNGVTAGVTSAYTPTPSEMTGTSVWKNGNLGVNIDQGTGANALGPDGNVAGKLANAIYGNGTFGFSQTEKWQQLRATRSSLDVDWTGTYWGPVSHIACGLGQGNGHLSYGASDPNPAAVPQVPRGPVSHVVDTQNPPFFGCANDHVRSHPAGTATTTTTLGSWTSL